MNRLMILAAGCLAATVTQSAGLYKCTDANGKTIYSQIQCAQDAAPVDLRVHQPSEAQIQEARERAAAIAETANAYTQAHRLSREMEDRQIEIDRLAARRDRELSSLRRQRAFSANNLAGATRDNALAIKEQAVVDNYNAQIDALRQSADRLMDSQ